MSAGLIDKTCSNRLTDKYFYDACVEIMFVPTQQDGTRQNNKLAVDERNPVYVNIHKNIKIICIK